MVWVGVDEQYANPGLILSSSETDTAITDWINLPGASTTGGATGSNQCTTSYATNGTVTLQLSTVWEWQWDTNGLGTIQIGGSTNAGCGIVTNMGAPSAYLGPITFPGIEGDSIYLEDRLHASPPEVRVPTQGARTQFMLQTGGRRLPVHQSLHAIEAQAWMLEPPVYEDIYPDCLDDQIPNVVYIPPELVTILGLPQNSDGFVWLVLPDGEDLDVTPQAPSVPFYLCDPAECKYTFTPNCQSPIPTNTNRTDIGVGEFVNLSFEPNTFRAQGVFAPFLPTNTLWTASAGSPAQTNWSDIFFIAPSNAANVRITTQLPNGQTLNNNLIVLAPTNCTATWLSNFTVLYSPNQAGVGQALTVLVLPTNVSFGRVQLFELGEDASGTTGYFASTNIQPGWLEHSTNQGANNWFYLGQDNTWIDQNCMNGPLYPWSSGSVWWNIPAYWLVGDNLNQTSNSLTTWTQTVEMLDASGTMSVNKFRNTATRWTNNSYSNWPSTNSLPH